MGAIHLSKLGIDVVHGCQLRCIGCPNSTINPSVWAISLEDFQQILDNIDVGSVGLFRLFNFGEPLFHRDLAGILNLIKEWRKTIPVGLVEISTNAQYHNYTSLFPAFDTGQLDRLSVSCDGDATPESYERLRPPGKWATLIEFLETVADYVRSRNLSIKLITRTICAEPAHQRAWASLLRPLGWEPEFRDWLLLPESQLAADENFRKAHLPGVGICSFLRASTLYVDASGDVVPCCVHPAVTTLGNLKETPFSKIYAGLRASFAASLAEERTLHPICSQCQF